ncbi:MAG TPA: lytic polysaccharide monooxygenase [Steroidobacteraceae bacterium]|nr:lytic polysaccharide monooxygenase [Steroidobacteraceae bacterium]
MRIDLLRGMILCVFAFLTQGAFAHGLVQDPPARNWFCGAVTKPDHVQNGVAQYPVCGGAFFAPGIEPTAGYSFMSVLTHTTGRAGVGTRTNVCGFNSETWNGAATVWDQAIDWPTVPMTAGPRNFTWNISWGPHFSDSSDFRYWITKPGFVWQTGRPLTFADFEDAPFCDLAYNDATPNANPNLVPDKANAMFLTRCTVPSRSGRHVIYAEWGRTPPTFERFHGCIDAQFSGSPPPTVTANIVTTPANVATFTGSGSIALNGSSSVGSNLSYTWSVDSENPSLYSITNPMSAQATLNLGVPQASGNVTVNLLVTSGNSSDTETRTILHQPAVSNQWFDLGVLTADARTLVVGDRVNVRTVSTTGQDAFWPTTPITITSANTGATQWPVTLANAVNALNGNVRIGVLNAQNQVVPAANATSNRVYSLTSANIASAFLQVVIGAVPTAPTGLAGTPGNAQVALTWNAVSGATAYNVKRSTTNGGPYANVAQNVTGTAYTNTGLTNGTPYYYVVTAVNSSGESPVSLQVSATPAATGGETGGVTVTKAVTSASPWFNEIQVRLANTSSITAMTVTVVVQRTPGVSYSGAYNTVGGQISQANASTTSTVTYTWTLNAGQQLGASTSRTFAAQFGGNGTAHPVTGDTWTVNYTTGGVARSQTGSF